MQLSLVSPAGRPDQGVTASHAVTANSELYIIIKGWSVMLEEQTDKAADWVAGICCRSLLFCAQIFPSGCKWPKLVGTSGTKRVCHRCCCLALQQLRRSHTTCCFSCLVDSCTIFNVFFILLVLLNSSSWSTKSTDTCFIQHVYNPACVACFHRRAFVASY